MSESAQAAGDCERLVVCSRCGEPMVVHVADAEDRVKLPIYCGACQAQAHLSLPTTIERWASQANTPAAHLAANIANRSGAGPAERLHL